MANVRIPSYVDALFVTLTYPKGDPQHEKHKTHLDSFLKALRRRFPASAALWKLEYTVAGTPHFHLILFGVPYWHHADLGQCWSSIVRSSHDRHKHAGTRVERLRSKKHALRYLSKYIAKPSAYPSNHRGRCWGRTASITAYLSDLKHWLVPGSAFAPLRRFLDRVRQAQNRRRRFQRAASVYNAARWFALSDTIERLAQFLNLTPIPLPQPP